MLEQLTSILNQYGGAFQEQIPRYRQNRFVQIVVLRETKSHAIFTTEGQTLDVERLQAGITQRAPIDRVVMYKRKQIAPERRTGKALLRDLGILGDANGAGSKKDKKIKPSECQIMGGSCGSCPDCILYGFAATTGTGSQRARVLTDSGFVVRGISQVMRDIKLNAIQDTVAGGIAGSAFASRENVLPQIFIPTVETLLDITRKAIVRDLFATIFSVSTSAMLNYSAISNLRSVTTMPLPKQRGILSPITLISPILPAIGPMLSKLR
jgi:CRISPR-associated protein Csc2